MVFAAHGGVNVVAINGVNFTGIHGAMLVINTEVRKECFYRDFVMHTWR